MKDVVNFAWFGVGQMIFGSLKVLQGFVSSLGERVICSFWKTDFFNPDTVLGQMDCASGDQQLDSNKDLLCTQTG